MNVIEAYIKFQNRLVIFISGLSGCKKTQLTQKLANNLNINHIDQSKYYKSEEEYNKTYTLPDGTDIINWNTDDAIDWDKLNNDIKKIMESNKGTMKGLIVSGFSLPEDKLLIIPDYHIHLSISKQKCLNLRINNLMKQKEKNPSKYENIDETIEKLEMNQLIFPYYLEVVKRSKINKFINITELKEQKIYDLVFDTIIEFVQKFLLWFNTNKFHTWKKQHPDDDLSSDSISSNIMDSEDDNEDDDKEDEIEDGLLKFVDITEGEEI